MRRALAALLLLALPVPSNAAPAALAVEGDAPGSAVAGATLAWNVTVRAPAPWTGGEVALAADAGAEVDPAAVAPDPLTGEARAVVRWRPAAPGAAAVTVTARGAEAEGAASFPFEVAPARVDVALAAGAPSGWQVPLAGSLALLDAEVADVALDLQASYAAPEGWTAAWREPWERAAFAASAEASGAFLARYGAGTYALTLAANGTARGASPALVLPLDAPGPVRASTEATWDGQGEPAVVTLTSDTVNADGKLKAPGEELVTRFVVEDPDGLAGEVRVLVRSPSGRLAFTDAVALPNGTRASLEHRFAASPLAAGTWTVELRKDEGAAARTFVAREARPALLAADVAPAPVRAGAAARVEFLVGDRNLDEEGAGPGVLVAKLYRASTAVFWRLEHGGRAANGTLALDLANATAATPGWRVVDGHGALPAVVRVDVPAGATPAAYRLALYHDGTKLGEAPFDVAPPARLLDARVTAARPGGALRVAGLAEGLARVTVVVEAPVNATVEAPVASGAFAAEVPLPRGLAAGTPVAARVVGEGVEAAVAGAVENAPPEPALVVRLDGFAAPPRALPGAVLDVEAAADDPNGEAAAVRVRLLDPQGREAAQASGGRLAVPREAARGMWRVEAVATDAAGAANATAHPLAVGAWVEAGFLDAEARVRPERGALVARARVVNAGNVPVGEAHVEVGELAGPNGATVGNATVRLLVGGRLVGEAPVVAGAAALAVEWPPGEAVLEVRWPRPADAPRGAWRAPIVLAVRGA